MKSCQSALAILDKIIKRICTNNVTDNNTKFVHNSFPLGRKSFTSTDQFAKFFTSAHNKFANDKGSKNILDTTKHFKSWDEAI